MRNDAAPHFQVVDGSDALRGFGNIRVAGEAGRVIEKRFGLCGAWRARAELRKGFGGHTGAIANLSITRAERTGRAVWLLGPRVTFASADFTRTYFGIDALHCSVLRISWRKRSGMRPLTM